VTKMQAVRYSIAFRVMKAAEGYFDAATCLSGPLSCYRKDLVLKYMDAWLNQRFLGQKATFGDDRSMTNFILRRNRTTYQDSAVCMTIVPRSYSVFLRQQMRWNRSWLRESLIASRFMWKKEPFMSLGFYMGVLVPIAAPVVARDPDDERPPGGRSGVRHPVPDNALDAVEGPDVVGHRAQAHRSFPVGHGDEALPVREIGAGPAGGPGGQARPRIG